MKLISTLQWSNILIVKEEPFSNSVVISKDQVAIHTQFKPTRHNLTPKPTRHNLTPKQTPKAYTGFPLRLPWVCMGSALGNLFTHWSLKQTRVFFTACKPPPPPFFKYFKYTCIDICSFFSSDHIVGTCIYFNDKLHNSS